MMETDNKGGNSARAPRKRKRAEVEEWGSDEVWKFLRADRQIEKCFVCENEYRTGRNHPLFEGKVCHTCMVLLKTIQHVTSICLKNTLVPETLVLLKSSISVSVCLYPIFFSQKLVGL